MEDFDDIVVSSRIRLARNIKNMNFPNRLSDYDEALSITKGIYEILNSIGDFEFHKIKNMSNIQSLVLLEKHLISKELLDNKDISSLAICYKDGLSVMINEEDHIREQCVIDGFDLNEAYRRINLLDELILENFSISFDSDLGFLTASPSNLGTGLRGSVMLFLPALTMLGKINSLSNNVSKLGLTVRGAYGEGSLAKGYLYQISNESTLGKSEETILANVSNITTKICEMEKEFRAELFKIRKDEIKDMCGRAWGILNYANSISCDEAVKLIADVKLAKCLKINFDIDIKTLNDLLTTIQPAHLIQEFGREIASRQRDIYRAEIIQKAIKKN